MRCASRAYDWVAGTAESWRILPVLRAGRRRISQLQLPEEAVVRVLLDIFEHRANSPKHIPIAPLDEYIRAAALKIAGEHAGTGSVARDLLDNIFVINVNGDVFTRPFAYDDAHCLGNIGRVSMIEMIAGGTLPRVSARHPPQKRTQLPAIAISKGSATPRRCMNMVR